MRDDQVDVMDAADLYQPRCQLHFMRLLNTEPLLTIMQLLRVIAAVRC